ncbi:hypothetical protein [Anaerosacchariphilus polymeriproducens]|uniref:Butirosin biosynthesis protein H N-terminal domain-containing protein n=1 Tax=Anaerosacchariphilus polymeriproducens TaxID=1812858 RepID=A0A371AS48_9FIRM|nr:hypothetical protein [Anaerosacchariphilus polymeriproducens]RDU22375.1 hypothetical protein DWV06_13845 [Anaerosacchariphilus polymeriproducens]
MRNVLDMKFIGNSQDGDCFIKCLQEIYYWYGYPINTYKILGITNCLNFKVKDEGNGKLKTIREMDRINNRMINSEIRSGATLDECFECIFSEIDKQNPLVALVNTFYLYYTGDYLKRSGGFFKGYHGLIINGYDKVNKKIVVTDLVYDKYNVEIAFEEFALAWTYTKDAPFFKPLKYIVYSCDIFDYDYSSLMKESLVYSLQIYLNDLETWNQDKKKSINIFSMLFEFDKIVKGECLGKERTELVENLSYSIFHEVRWSRKSMGLFLASEEICEMYDFTSYSKSFYLQFDKWTLAHNMLLTSIRSNNEKRFFKTQNLIRSLIFEENDLVKDLMTLLK